jgi:hypothetical protein
MHLGDVESDYPSLDEGLEFAFFLRKQALERSEERAFNVFDGGETVYVKIMDSEGTEYVRDYTPGGGRWQAKKRGMKLNAEDVVATHGVAEAYRLGLLK